MERNPGIPIFSLFCDNDHSLNFKLFFVLFFFFAFFVLLGVIFNEQKIECLILCWREDVWQILNCVYSF